MKFILNLFKGLAVLYWVLAASLFTSVLFFPSAIDSLYGAYSGIVGEPTSSEVSISSSEEAVTSSEETVRCLAITPECGWEIVVIETEILVISIDEELPAGVEFFISAESLLDDDLFATLLVFNIDSAEWEEIQVPLSAPEIIEHESFWFDQELGIIFYAELVDVWQTGGPDPIPEEEIVLGEMTRDEFVLALEEILIYSAIFMLPFTILVFTVGAKLNEASSEIDPNPEVIIENKEAKKQAAKTRTIGVTRLRVRK
jgi:hypothetical protein